MAHLGDARYSKRVVLGAGCNHEIIIVKPRVNRENHGQDSSPIKRVKARSPMHEPRAW